jgi:hypothetical protein
MKGGQAGLFLAQSRKVNRAKFLLGHKGRARSSLFKALFFKKNNNKVGCININWAKTSKS